MTAVEAAASCAYAPVAMADVAGPCPGHGGFGLFEGVEVRDW